MHWDLNHGYNTLRNPLLHFFLIHLTEAVDLKPFRPGTAFASEHI